MTSRDEDVLTAASMYYLQDMKMESIARHLGTSRSTVSRLVKQARELGLVEISVHPARSRAEGLGPHIRDMFNVEVYVVPVPASGQPFDHLEQVALTAARLIAGWFDSDMVLAVAWGTTISAVGQHLPRKPTRGGAIVQLNGAANPRTSGIGYASELISRFGHAFDAQTHHFPVPAFFDYAATKQAMWRERSVRRVLEMQNRADVALFSVGAVQGAVPSHVYTGGYLDPDDIDALDRAGVVGDVCTVFLRQDGTYEDIAINQRATGPTPAQLRKIDRRVCVAVGDNKVLPLRAALGAGVITHLVVDELTAAALIK